MGGERLLLWRQGGARQEARLRGLARIRRWLHSRAWRSVSTAQSMGQTAEGPWNMQPVPPNRGGWSLPCGPFGPRMGPNPTLPVRDSGNPARVGTVGRELHEVCAVRLHRPDPRRFGRIVRVDATEDDHLAVR